MRVLVAPDGFGGTLSAPQAAAAIRDGWLRAAPGDDIVVRPLADGGPGFVDVLHAALGGSLHTLTVTGPLGAPVEATWLEHDGTGYVEVAQACGLHLVPRAERRPLDATSRGVGELLAAVRDAGLRRAVVGLGGSATTDGGAGLLAALGAIPVDTTGTPLPDGGAALARCARLSGRPDLGTLTLVAATDVDNPLLGPHGAAHVFAPQKGATPADVTTLDAALTTFAAVLARDLGVDHGVVADVESIQPDHNPVINAPGAGAAGGMGAALLGLGASRESGAGVVRGLTGLDSALDGVQLAVTGEGSFDWQSLRGKLVTAVASGAAERGVPCLVLAGQVSVGRREAAAAGVDEAYAVAEHAGSVEAAFADPAGTLAALAESVARQWGGR